MKGKIFSGLILIITISILVFYSNCTKNSTKFYYRRDHYLYTNGTGGSKPNQWIYVISTETDSVVDSICLGPYKWPGYMELSPDKRTLYVIVDLFDTITYSSTSTYYEIDTRTKAIKYTGPNSSTEISPDGRYLFGAVERNFTIFDARTHQIVYQESTLFSPICFDKKAPLAYGGGAKKGGR